MLKLLMFPLDRSDALRNLVHFLTRPSYNRFPAGVKKKRLQILKILEKQGVVPSIVTK